MVDKYDWRYAEAPDIPETVYVVATFYMVVVGVFGIVSNGSVIVAYFLGSPQVGCLT